MEEQKIQTAWENRAQIFKDTREAVLQQSLPPVLNNYVHQNIHLSEVFRMLPKGKITCLDIGCGYGRIAQEIVKKNNQAFVHGIDISETFISLFNKKLGKNGKGVVAGATNLPFKDNTFDFVVVIVTLMYLEEKADQQRALQEILRVLKPGGRALIIEPNENGTRITKAFGIIPFLYRVFRKKKAETFGQSFPWNSIDTFIENAKGTLAEKRGYPIFTFLFIPLIVISKLSPKLTRLVLSVINRLDRILRFAKVSYLVSYSVFKN